MMAFLKSLRFWRYRSLYFAALQEKAELGFQVALHRKGAEMAFAELRRLQRILAPYGESIMAGQAEGTTGVIRLPELEYEMAKAFFHANDRQSEDPQRRVLSAGFHGYIWRGRPVRCIEREEYVA